MKFKRGEHFQSKHSQHIWNKIGNYNSGSRAHQAVESITNYWAWGQVAGAAVAEFNKSVGASGVKADLTLEK